MLSFLGRYNDKVDSLDLSGSYHDYYAPSCKFYNTNGAVYDGGEAIWTWMKGLFGVFDTVRHEHKSIRIFPAAAEEWDPASNAQWVFIDSTTFFQFAKKPSGPDQDEIQMPRFLCFLVGKSEVEGQGTDGLQILQAKVWRDTRTLVPKQAWAVQRVLRRLTIGAFERHEINRSESRDR